MGLYQYQELPHLPGYFPCPWVVLVDFFKEESAYVFVKQELPRQQVREIKEIILKDNSVYR